MVFPNGRLMGLAKNYDCPPLVVELMVILPWIYWNQWPFKYVPCSLKLNCY